MVVKRAGKKMLGDKIMAKLNKPKMKDYDIEDEDFKSTTNAEQDNDDDDEDDDGKALEEMAKREHYVKVSKSKIRDTTINLGDKYTGSKVGRDQLFDDDKQSDDEDEEDEVDEDEDEEDILADVTDSEEELIEEEQDVEDSDNEDQSEIDDNSNEEELSEAEDEDEAYKRERIVKLLDSEKQQILSRLSTSAKSDALKGYTVLKQGSEYDRVLDARIKIQKAVLASNNLPVELVSYKENKTEDTETIVKSTEDKLYSLIDRLIRLRSNQLVKDNLVKEPVNIKISKKRSLSEYLEANKKINDAVEPVTKSVLVKWSNRVQSASGMGALNQGKFKVINQNVWSQVNNQLGDLERLIKKTKINRRNITPLGYNADAEKKVESDEDDDDEDNVKSAGLSNIDKSLQTNDHIFDDDDFYRLLLNDMINKKLDQKQATTSAVLMLSKNKMQKNYDRMATKGRKLKYTVQEPLQQFEIPRRKYYAWGDDQIDELFAGLFGMSFKMEDSDSEDEAHADEQKSEDISALRESGVKLFG